MVGAGAGLTRSTLTAYADAWRAGDFAQLLEFYAEDVTFHLFGTTDLAGIHVGKEACVGAMLQTAFRAHRELVEVVDVLAGEVLGSIVAIERFERPDARIEPVEVRRTFVYRVGPDGRIVETWVLDEDQGLMDRLWA